MAFPEYLVSYGAAGYLGRFVPQTDTAFQRGDRVVVRSRRGLEVGTILSASAEGYAEALHDQAAGNLLRHATPTDESRLAHTSEIEVAAFEAARRLAQEMGLGLEFIDAESIAEPRTLVLHYVGLGDGDLRPLVSSLATAFDAQIELLDLTPPWSKSNGCSDHGESGCGSCGDGCGSGGCGTCGDGGCGSGCSAGKADSFEQEWQAYFAELRSQMDKRIPLARV